MPSARRNNCRHRRHFLTVLGAALVIVGCQAQPSPLAATSAPARVDPSVVETGTSAAQTPTDEVEPAPLIKRHHFHNPLAHRRIRHRAATTR